MTQGPDQRLAVQFAVVRVLAGSTALPEALAGVLAETGRGMGWSVGVAWGLMDGGQLVATELWQASEEAFARFAKATRAAAFGRGQGLPGTVWETGSPAWVTDAGADATFTRCEPAALDGLRRGLAFPVLSGGTVLGVIEFFGTEAGEPDNGLLDLAAAIGTQLGQFVERLHGAEALRGSEARATAVVESALDCVVSVDAAGRIVEFNPAAERTFGYPRHQVVGRELAEVLIPPDLRDAHRDGFGRALESGTVRGLPRETTAMRADGSLLPVELTVTRVDLPGGPLFTGFIRDLTERRRAETEIAFLSHHDKLTGLPNRTLFEQVLDEALDRARQRGLGVGVLSMDLNNFKLVNDSLGHAAGDALLQEISIRLSEVTRESDVVARLGGDEFVLLLGELPTPHAPATGEGNDAVLTAESVAARVHEVLAAPFRLADSEFYVTASIGISVYPDDAEDGQAMLRNADAAMYQSKRSGPGGSVVYSHHASDAGRLLSMATRLRQAVERSDWIIHYQPVVSLFDGRMVGVEALLRWVERDGSLVQPNDFIPLAEEMGLIEPIGEWVLDEVCRQARIWQDADIALDMSFNLSPRQLWQPELSRRVVGTVESSGVDPHRMIIEITESATMADPERTQHILWDLHRRGLRLALDDFGTGYSSLSRLKHLPVDILKIDRSFVHDLPGTREARSMVRAIIQLAHGLGMVPLAEGVETEAQWRFLTERGCPLGQGYQFGHPVPAEAIAEAYVRGAVTVLHEPAS